MSAMQPPQRVPSLQEVCLVVDAQRGTLKIFASASSRLTTMPGFPLKARQQLYQSSAYHRPKSNSPRCVNHTRHTEFGGEAELQRLSQAKWTVAVLRTFDDTVKNAAAVFPSLFSVHRCWAFLRTCRC